MDSAQKAEILRRLHRGTEPLVMANVWDCASARVVEQAGFPAVATTSAGVASSLGYPDGQHVSRAEMLEVVKRIAQCVSVPVSADLEAGYGDVEETTRALVASGAVGLNIEDMDKHGGRELVRLSEQIDRIHTVRHVSGELGVGVVINARTDYYLASIGDPAKRFDAACERLRRYIDAGADCVFVPGITDEDLIRRFVEALRFPLNVLVGPGTPPISRLKQIGVARVSVGSGVARATMGLVRRIANELKTTGEYGLLQDGAVTYDEANQLFERRAAQRG